MATLSASSPSSAEAPVPSIADKLIGILLGKPPRYCVMCMRKCPTDAGKPLPEGWTQPKSYPFMYLIPSDEDAMCPSCAKAHPIF